MRLSLLLAVLLLSVGTVLGEDEPTPRSHIQVRGVYGGVPQSLMESGKPLTDSGINAVWIGVHTETGEFHHRVQVSEAPGTPPRI